MIALPESGALAWSSYAQGYLKAGELVLRAVFRTGSDQDLYVYPLVFLYRQYLELQLKHVIQLGWQLHGGRGKPVDTHSLVALWDLAYGHIRQEWPDDEGEARAIRHDLDEFDALDRGSYAFRYPVGTRRQPSLPAELQRFNLRTFAIRSQEIGEYLDGASEGLWNYLDWEREMAAEYEP